MNTCQRFAWLLVLLLGGGCSFRESTLMELADLVPVSGGSFLMGDNRSPVDAAPVHRVRVSDFLLGRMEVTQELWIRVMGKNPSHFVDLRRPVEKVTWWKTVEFCNRLSEACGLQPVYKVTGTTIEWDRRADGFRLPTEAEWEWAARGGSESQGFDYAGSNNPGVVGWIAPEAGEQTHPVGQKKPNELGLYDLCGNVAEPCWDWKASYEAEDQVDPIGPPEGNVRAVRGGHAAAPPTITRNVTRAYNTQSNQNLFQGLRLARNALVVLRSEE